MIVNFDCAMHPVVQAEFGLPSSHQARLSIRMAALNPRADLPPEIAQGSLWVWCVVQEIPGRPDRYIIGGQADSMTSATAQAQQEYAKQQARLAKGRSS
jgi:hypothetical protein